MLPEDNELRLFIQHEIELAKIFADSGLDLLYPISGASGIISKNEINNLFDCMTAKGLLNINLIDLQHHVSSMQTILG